MLAPTPPPTQSARSSSDRNAAVSANLECPADRRGIRATAKSLIAFELWICQESDILVACERGGGPRRHARKPLTGRSLAGSPSRPARGAWIETPNACARRSEEGHV